MKKSTSQKKLYIELFARATNSFVDWWARVTNFLVDWWARVINSFVDGWMKELLAILLSFIAFFATIFIFRKDDDHALPTLPHNVPLGFVVPILATVSKNSLFLAVAFGFGQFKWF